ncbi:hypothetical protein KDA11_06805 [Candidatus Saccharibacteria bacterium]|nr:hypothetical protein [Candidatus Saccharibacteria bacterium]
MAEEKPRYADALKAERTARIQSRIAMANISLDRQYFDSAVKCCMEHSGITSGCLISIKNSSFLEIFHPGGWAIMASSESKEVLAEYHSIVSEIIAQNFDTSYADIYYDQKTGCIVRGEKPNTAEGRKNKRCTVS